MPNKDLLEIETYQYVFKPGSTPQDDRDNDYVPINRQARYIAPFSNDPNEYDPQEKHHPEDQEVPNVLLDEYPDESVEDPDDPDSL